METNFSQKLADALTVPAARLLTRAAELLQRPYIALKSWMLTAVLPQPQHVLSGYLLLGVGVAATVSNYRLMVQAIEFLLPVGEWATLLAFVIVALAGACGFILHTRALRGIKVVTVFVFLALLTLEGVVAYSRGAGVDRILEPPRQTSPKPVRRSGVMIDNAVVPVSSPQAQPSEPAAVSVRVSMRGLLAACMAIVFAAGVMICFWVGFSQAGSAVSRLAAFPVLFLIAVPLSILHMVNASRWDSNVNPVLAHLFDAIGALVARLGALSARIQAAFLKTVRDIVSYCSASSRHERRLRAIRQKAECDALTASAELERALRHAMSEHFQGIFADCQKQVAEGLTHEHAEVPARIYRDVLTGVEEQVKAKLHPVVEDLMYRSIRDAAERMCVNGARIKAMPELDEKRKEIVQ